MYRTLRLVGLLLNNGRKRRPVMQEKGVMLAVLQNGIRSFLQYRGSRGRTPTAVREAIEWIESDDPRLLYSFASICESLGIPGEELRSELLEWKEGVDQACIPRARRWGSGESKEFTIVLRH